MREELDKKLVEKYPKIFAQRFDDMRTTAMCWGFDCDDGWYWILDRLCNSVQNYIDNNKIPQVTATQVKEKYGGLNFYYTGGDSMTDGMVWLAESMSYRTCETCGSTNNVTQTEGWIYTRCEKCIKQK